MAKPWAEVAKSDGYRALSSAEREEARNEYWREVVAPRVPVAELMGVRQAFDADTAPGLLAHRIRAQESIGFVSFGHCGQAQQGLWPLTSSTKQGFKQIVARHTLRPCNISQDRG